MTTIVDRVHDAEAALDVICRITKSKFTPPERADRIQQLLLASETARVADALERLTLRIPAPVGEGREIERWKWIEEHPQQWTWLRANRESKTFAASLNRALEEFGALTDKQQQVLDEIVKEEQ